MTPDRLHTPEFRRLPVRLVDVAGNTGPCEGVNMAIDVTETVLREVNGREPVFTTNPIVHNDEVMNEFTSMGLILVNQVRDIPRESIGVNSAHGVTAEDLRIAEELGLIVINTTCPLVDKVRYQGLRAIRLGAAVVYIGSYRADGRLHQESRGILGQLEEEHKESIRFVTNINDLEDVDLPFDKPIRILNQTTLATDEFRDIVDEIQRRRPDAVIDDGICYATDNRQNAVVDLAERVDAVLVMGSSNISHNTKMLAERAQREGKKVFLIENESDLHEDNFAGVEKLGFTTGASVRTKASIRVLSWFHERGADVQYSLPVGPEPYKGFRWPLQDLKKFREYLAQKYAP